MRARGSRHGRPRSRHGRPASGDAGTAIVEFVFVAIAIMVPLLYLVVGVAAVERSALAVSQAAREAGRAFATADRAEDALLRARAAVRLALANQGLPADASLSFAAAGGSCDGPGTSARLAPGAEFTICVRRHVDVPGVPRLLAGRGITTVGRYVVHVDDYRAPR